MKIAFVNLKAQLRSIGPEINSALKKILETSAFILGREVKLFEKEFAKYCGVKYCLGVNSGTSALHLALLVNKIGRGDEVITQPNTFFATAEAISYCGARPVFVDINLQTHAIDIDKAEKSITKKTKCILPVHLFGNATEMEKLKKIVKKHNLILIEDACQAQGVSYQNKKLGTFGKVGCFSFYPGKVLGAYGEGGAVVTNDRKLYQEMQALRDHGQFKKSEHGLIGYNYRMDGIQGAVLRIKLRKLDKWILERRKKAKLYNKLLKEIKKITVPPASILNSSNFQYYVIRCKNRNKLKDYLAKKGVSTQIHYPIPIHLQRAYKFLGYKKGDFPESEKAAKEILSLPLFPELKLKEQRYIAQKIKEFYLR